MSARGMRVEQDFRRLDRGRLARYAAIEGNAPMQYRRISADCHLDMIWLPPDLFTSQAPRDLKERMPFITDGPNGKEWVANNGASFGLVGGVGSAGAKYVPGKQHRADRMNETGLYEDGKKGI